MSWVLAIDATDLTRVDTDPRYTPGLVVQRLIPWRSYGTPGQGEPGTELSSKTQMEQLKYIQYVEGSGAVAAAADAMTYFVSNSGYRAHQVTSDVSDTDLIPAGTLVGAPADGQYGWIWIFGTGRIGPALTGAPVEGNPLTGVGTTDGSANVRNANREPSLGLLDDTSGRQLVQKNAD